MGNVPQSEWYVEPSLTFAPYLSISAKERPIGFYHTGPRLRSSDLEISELFKRFCDRPVMVIVDVRATGGRGDTGIPTDAYFAVEEIKDVG